MIFTLKPNNNLAFHSVCAVVFSLIQTAAVKILLYIVPAVNGLKRYLDIISCRIKSCIHWFHSVNIMYVGHVQVGFKIFVYAGRHLFFKTAEKK